MPWTLLRKAKLHWRPSERSHQKVSCILYLIFVVRKIYFCRALFKAFLMGPAGHLDKPSPAWVQSKAISGKNIKSFLRNRTQGGMKPEPQVGQGRRIISKPQAQERLSWTNPTPPTRPPNTRSCSSWKGLPLRIWVPCLCRDPSPVSFLLLLPPFQASSPRRTCQTVILPFLPRNSRPSC